MAGLAVNGCGYYSLASDLRSVQTPATVRSEIMVRWTRRVVRNIMKHSSSLKGSSCPSGQLPHVLHDPKIRCSVSKSPSVVTVPSEINSVHSSPSFTSRAILILSSHILLGLPSRRFSSGLPAKIRYVFFFAPVRATCPTQLILFSFDDANIY